MGSLAGKAWTDMEGGLDLKQKHRTIEFDYHPYGGESAKEVKKRVLAFLKKIKGKHRNHEALIVTHGGIIRLLYFLEHNKYLLGEIEHITFQVFDVGKILKQNLNHVS